MAGKKNFGGYAVKFGGRTESLESIMGDKPIGPAEMTKKTLGVHQEAPSRRQVRLFAFVRGARRAPTRVPASRALSGRSVANAYISTPPRSRADAISLN
jgi:hypothetical protein